MNDNNQGGSGGEAPGANPRHTARSEPAAIALRMEDLTVWVIERAAKMPRTHKFTVGDKLADTCLDITALLVEASFARDKLALLASASRALTRARVLVRVAHRLRLLSEAQREHFAEESVAIGCQPKQERAVGAQQQCRFSVRQDCECPAIL